LDKPETRAFWEGGGTVVQPMPLRLARKRKGSRAGLPRLKTNGREKAHKLSKREGEHLIEKEKGLHSSVGTKADAVHMLLVEEKWFWVAGTEEKKEVIVREKKGSDSTVSVL